jgi:hypothetical protein
VGGFVFGGFACGAYPHMSVLLEKTSESRNNLNRKRHQARVSYQVTTSSRLGGEGGEISRRALPNSHVAKLCSNDGI